MLIRTRAIAAGVGGLAFAGATALPVLAQANGQGDAATPADAKPVSEIASMLETKGYAVREIDREDGVYEVELTNADGLRLEAYVDPTSGAFLNDDRDDDGDRDGKRERDGDDDR